MKITQTNNDELILKSSGIGNVVAGAIMAMIGVVMAVFAFLAENTAWMVALIGGIFAVFSILLILSAKNSHTVLRREGESQVDETKIVTRKKTSRAFSLSQVASVGLETNTSYERSGSGQDSSTNRVRTSVLYLQLSDNSQIPLATKKSSKAGFVGIGGVNLGSFGKPPLTDEANKIATFIGVPLNAQSTGQVGIQSFGQMADTIRKGAAPKPQQLQETAQPQPQAAVPQEVMQSPAPTSPQPVSPAPVEAPVPTQQVAEAPAPVSVPEPTPEPVLTPFTTPAPIIPDVSAPAPAPASAPAAAPAQTSVSVQNPVEAPAAPQAASVTPFTTPAPAAPAAPPTTPGTPPARVAPERTQEIVVPPRR